MMSTFHLLSSFHMSNWSIRPTLVQQWSSAVPSVFFCALWPCAWLCEKSPLRTPSPRPAHRRRGAEDAEKRCSHRGATSPADPSSLLWCLSIAELLNIFELCLYLSVYTVPLSVSLLVGKSLRYVQHRLSDKVS